MSKIPPDILEKIRSDPFFQRSCLSGKTPVQIHHCVIHKGRQVNALFCLLPLTPEEHRNANRPNIKRRLEEIMQKRATEQEKREYAWFFKQFHGEIV